MLRLLLNRERALHFDCFDRMVNCLSTVDELLEEEKSIADHLMDKLYSKTLFKKIKIEKSS